MTTPSDESPPLPNTPIRVAVAAVWRRVDRDGATIIEVLAARRHASAVLGGYWELPGGKIESGETPDAAARREVEEETGIRLGATAPLGAVEPEPQPVPPPQAAATSPAQPTARTPPRVVLHAVLAEVNSMVEAKPLASAECRWVPLDEFDTYQWPPANARLNAMVRAALERERGTTTT